MLDFFIKRTDPHSAVYLLALIGLNRLLDSKNQTRCEPAWNNLKEPVFNLPQTYVEDW